MKTIQQANEQLLHLMFDWKRREGRLIRFNIEKEENKWILTFFSVLNSGRDTHAFASFTGKSHEELKKWALDSLVSYNLNQTLKV